MKKSLAIALLLLITAAAYSQQPAGNYPPLTTFTAQQDHAQMLSQLSIQKLRPGPSGNSNAPNHANEDESVANPCPCFPMH